MTFEKPTFEQVASAYGYIWHLAVPGAERTLCDLPIDREHLHATSPKWCLVCVGMTAEEE